MTEGEVDVGRLADLIRLAETRGLEELVVEEGGCRYAIRGSGRVMSSGRSHEQGMPPTEHAGLAGPSAESAAPDRSGWIMVAAPMVGVFYRSPAPGEPPIVSLGDPVEQGQVIGIIEAMKVFSEVPSEHEGRVVELVAEDGQLVRAGDPLMYLAPESVHHRANELENMHDA